MVPFYTSLEDYIKIHEDKRWLELMGFKKPEKKSKKRLK